MIEAVAVVLWLLTLLAWLAVATPQLVDLWIAFAQDLDPSRAPQEAVLFEPVAPTES